MTLAEGQRCAPGAPLITDSQLAQQLPTTFLLQRANGSYAYEVVPAPAPQTTLMAQLTSCYNTWTYPSPWATNIITYVNISVAGYGNHCGYANVPSNPTPHPQCSVIGCTVSVQVGHADSNWDLANYNIDSALGWGNFTFGGSVGIDTWACRAWVDTNGNQNPGGWCH